MKALSKLAAVIYLFITANIVFGQLNTYPEPRCDSITLKSISSATIEVYANNVQNTKEVCFGAGYGPNPTGVALDHRGVYDSANNRWKACISLADVDYVLGFYWVYAYAIGQDGNLHSIGTTYIIFYEQPPIYLIEAVHSAKSLLPGAESAEIEGVSTVCQYAFPPGGNNQQHWMLQWIGEDKYIIRNVKSGKVLDVMYDSIDNGARICVWDYEGFTSQQWHLELDNASDTYVIRNVNSGKVLDVMYDSTNDSAPICQWDYVGADSQRWRLKRLM